MGGEGAFQRGSTRPSLVTLSFWSTTQQQQPHENITAQQQEQHMIYVHHLAFAWQGRVRMQKEGLGAPAMRRGCDVQTESESAGCSQFGRNARPHFQLHAPAVHSWQDVTSRDLRRPPPTKQSYEHTNSKRRECARLHVHYATNHGMRILLCSPCCQEVVGEGKSISRNVKRGVPPLRIDVELETGCCCISGNRSC